MGRKINSGAPGGCDEIYVSLSRMNHDRPYSKENPIRNIDSVEEISIKLGYCGHCCGAMLAGVSLSEIQSVMGKAAASWSKIQETLDYYGITYSEKMVYPKGKTNDLPKCCIVYADGNSNYGMTENITVQRLRKI